MYKFAEKVMHGMDTLLNDNSFQNKFKTVSKQVKKDPKKAFEKFASEGSDSCDNCFLEIQELLPNASSELEGEIYSQIPTFAAEDEFNSFWSSKEACELCNKLRAEVGEPTIEQEQLAIAFDYITKNLLKTSQALEGMGLTKSAFAVDKLVESIINEASVKKLAQEKIEVDPSHGAIGAPSSNEDGSFEMPKVERNDIVSSLEKKDEDKVEADDTDVPGEAFNKLKGELSKTDKQIADLGKPREDQEAFNAIRQYMAQKEKGPFGGVEAVSPFEKAMMAAKKKEQDKDNEKTTEFFKGKPADVEFGVDKIKASPSDMVFEEDKITASSKNLQKMIRLARKR